MRHRLRVLNTETSKQMNNIYHESVQADKDGAKFRVDLERKNLTIDGKKIITNGEYEGELGMSLATLDDFLYIDIKELRAALIAACLISGICDSI